VADVLVLLVPKKAADEHLRILAEATGMLSDRRFREKLRHCSNSIDVKRLFETWLDSAV
jgi:mannitol/fructose-specific phosphotransferase system IIA component (Ntr-type)